MRSAIRPTFLDPILPFTRQSRTAAEAAALFWGWYLVRGRDYDWEQHVFNDDSTMLLESREYLEEGLRKQIQQEVQQRLNCLEMGCSYEISAGAGFQSTELRLTLASYSINPDDFIWPLQCTTHLTNCGEVNLEMGMPSLGRAYISLWIFKDRHSDY